MPADLHLDPEEGMSSATEHGPSGFQGPLSILRFPDHPGPVQLGRRQVRERDEEPVHLDDLAPFDHLGPDPFSFEPGGHDAIGKLHPRMLPRG
jgi:hypothetical protein